MEHRVNRPIPDLANTADVITFPLAVAIREIEVSLDIKHTWRGDLRVVLKTPQGRALLLHDRAGAGEDDLIRSYRSSDEPALFAPLIGGSAQGEWRLEVVDTAAQDVGVLVKWGLAITY